MKKNMGLVDRLIRVALAIAVAALIAARQLSTVATVILGVLAVVFLATSIVGTCPLYLPFGLSTRKRQAS